MNILSEAVVNRRSPNLCWHTLSSDPPGTEPYVTHGPPETCPTEHPELYEEVHPRDVHIDFGSGEPIEPDVFGWDGRWLRKRRAAS